MKYASNSEDVTDVTIARIPFGTIRCPICGKEANCFEPAGASSDRWFDWQCTTNKEHHGNLMKLYLKLQGFKKRA